MNFSLADEDKEENEEKSKNSKMHAVSTTSTK